jgi:hypothetical protein
MSSNSDSSSSSSSSISNIITSFNILERDSTVMNSERIYDTYDLEFKKLNYEFELILAQKENPRVFLRNAFLG